MTTCAIVQPSYIPWRGYFDLIRRSDVFVFYDDVQYDKHGWRNRNRIKTANGPTWLTIPVRKKGNVARGIPINEIEISPDGRWHTKHLAALRQSYSRAPHLERYLPLIERHLAEPPPLLADLTVPLTVALAQTLGFDRRFHRSSGLGITATDRVERLLEVLTGVGATRYLSGPSAGSYIDAARFADAGIDLEFVEYDYPEYPQLHPPFEPRVTVLDLLFMVGDDHLRYWNVTS